MLAPMVVLLLGLEGALAGHILSYKEDQHSRSEAGVPGNNVTGKWSWVDNHGQQHHIWYVADTGGFRAFGDVVPDTQQARPFLTIGTPVIGGDAGASTSNLASFAKSLPSPLPERKPFRIGTPVLGGPRITPDPSRSSHFSIFALGKIPEISKEEATLKADTKTTSTTLQVATPTPEAAFGTKTHLSQQGPIVKMLSKAEDSEDESTKVSEDREQDISTHNNGREGGEGEFKGASKSMSSIAAENGILQKVLGKAISTSMLPSPKDGRPNQLNTARIENKNMDIPLELLLPEPGPGSDFVLIDRLRPPTVPKPRLGSPQIVPKPVNVQNPSTKIVMGLYTSGNPPDGQRLTQPSTNLAPLGIHILNFSFRKNSKSLTPSTRPVPKPIRVVGAPNLENFYRPATLARTTPSPFRRPNPMRDYDYLYTDYDYYDYANYDTNTPAGGPKKSDSNNTQSSIDVSDESDNSGEQDSDEADK